MTKNLNRVAAKLDIPLHTSRGPDHAGMIGSSQRIPSGPVVSRLFAGQRQPKQAGHMTASTVTKVLPVIYPLTHAGRPHMTWVFEDRFSFKNNRHTRVSGCLGWFSSVSQDVYYSS